MVTRTVHHQASGILEGHLGASRIVASDKPVSRDSVFGDSFWDMTSLVTLPGTKNYQMSWDFGSVPGFPYGFALSLAEYADARLYRPIDEEGDEAAWLTVHNELVALNCFAEYCCNQGLHGFHQVDAVICGQYLRSLQFDNTKKKKSAKRTRYLVRVIYRLWDYRSAISECLPSLPFGRPFEKLFQETSARGSGANATPVIPEPIYSALMSAALDYVLDYSHQIIDAWQGLQEVWDNDVIPSGLSLSGGKKKLARLAKESLSGCPATWRARSWATYGDVYEELQQLRAACILVILAFSGIRVSELLSLEAGCYVADECEDGRIRHYINTRVHKHRERGSKDTWVVIDEVVKAIQILEVLTARVRKAAQDGRLILTDGTNCFFNVQRMYDGLDYGELTTGALIYQIQTFRNHCNNKLDRPSVPDWTDENGVTKPWSFNTRQFRRTLARFIARQPFGLIAGMIQYKHLEVTVFQGYAGSEPEWNKLLEEERVLASVDILEEVAMDLSNGQLAGDFGIKLKEEFAAEFRGRAEDFSPSQIAKWLASSKKSLFVGKFNFCFFDPSKALCTEGGVSAGGPILNFCQPDKCSNACIGKRHIVRWEAQLKQAEEFAAHPKSSAVQRELLEREVASLRTVINEFGK